MSISINITSVAVKDQQVAHDFYTQKLGFVVKHDIPMGEYRWLTLVAPNHLE
ncbi:VOC family protein [Vibrio sp. qd031]|nr:VOC family protein [Vibrio sp. qd031]